VGKINETMKCKILKFIFIGGAILVAAGVLLGFLLGFILKMPFESPYTIIVFIPITVGIMFMFISAMLSLFDDL